MLRILSNHFDRCSTAPSIFFIHAILHFVEQYKQIIRWHPKIHYSRIKRYAKRFEKYSGNWQVKASIERICSGVCWPSKEQLKLWSGYIKKYKIKYQSIVTSNGLIVFMGGPYLGKINDHCMVSVNSFQDDLYKVLSVISFTFSH